MSRPRPTPVNFTSPLSQQKRKKAKRYPFQEDLFLRRTVEDFCRQLENKTTTEARQVAIKFLFETNTSAAEGNSVGKLLDSLANKNKTTKNKVTSGAINYISNQADNNNGSVSSGNTLLVSVTKPRRKKVNALSNSRKKYIKDKADEIHKVVKVILGDELEKEVLTYALTSYYDLAVCDKYDSLINKREVLGICNEGEMLGVSYGAGFTVPTSVVCSITKNYNRLLIDKNLLVIDKPVVGQLQKKMGKLEMSGTVPIKIKQLDCFTTKTDTRMVIFITLKMYHYSWNDLL